MSKTKCMNGTRSKYGYNARERRWTVGAAEYIWMVLQIFRPSRSDVLWRRRRTDLESETLGRWIELNAEGGIRWKGEDESDAESQTFTLEIPHSLFMINFPSVTLTDSWILEMKASNFLLWWPWLCNKYILSSLYCTVLWWWNTTNWWLELRYSVRAVQFYWKAMYSNI